MKRDLKADLELCNKATPGPWEAEDGLADPMVVMGRDDSHYFYVHTEWDAQFIAQAREGWPYAIEKAIKAEALNRELGRALESVSEQLSNTLGVPIPDHIRELLTKAKEVLEDEETCAGRQSTSAKDY